MMAGKKREIILSFFPFSGVFLQLLVAHLPCAPRQPMLLLLLQGHCQQQVLLPQGGGHQENGMGLLCWDRQCITEVLLLLSPLSPCSIDVNCLGASFGACFACSRLSLICGGFWLTRSDWASGLGIHVHIKGKENLCFMYVFLQVQSPSPVFLWPL